MIEHLCPHSRDTLVMQIEDIKKLLAENGETYIEPSKAVMPLDDEEMAYSADIDID